LEGTGSPAPHLSDLIVLSYAFLTLGNEDDKFVDGLWTLTQNFLTQRKHQPTILDRDWGNSYVTSHFEIFRYPPPL
jgi:hypothetical protein